MDNDKTAGSGFFAMLARMKYISRWALMRNTESENLSEHSLETAFIAHALAVIGRDVYGHGTDPERAAVYAMFHDAPEILTGDMPTPVKYFTPGLRSAYAEVEKKAGERLLSMLPEQLHPAYRGLLLPDEEQPEYRYVKAADKLSALIKCIEERKAGNMEFSAAEQSTLASVRAMDMPEAEYFLDNFIPAYSLTLDASFGE